MSAIQPGGSGFSKLLVSTEKTERDRAIRLIAAWLVKRGDVSDQELAKLWKGIFYCEASQRSCCASISTKC
jgi:hypothetical protein